MRKIETIIRQQFSLEMKNKEHEIDVISQVPGWKSFFPPFSILKYIIHMVCVCVCVT